MSIFAPALSYCWKSADELGMDPDALFRQAGIDPRLRLDTTARISAQQFDDIVCLARETSRDDSFAFKVVRNIHPSYMGALGFAWMTSATVRDAFERLSRYYRLLTSEVQVAVAAADGSLEVVFDATAAQSRDPALRERLRLAGAVWLCRMIAGGSFTPKTVEFQQDAPANAGDYYEFFRCEQRFGQERTALVIAAAEADEALPGFNAQLLQQFDHMAISYLAELDRSDLLGRVRATVLEQLPSGEATLEAVADRLAMSSRTLTRKLRERGHNFKDLLAGIRRELAEKYIMDTSLTLTEISYLLGFSENSSFSRAYRGWTGMSPSAHRGELFADHDGG